MGSPTAPTQVLIPGEAAGGRFDKALCAMLPEHSRSRIQHWVKTGAVRLEGRVVEPAQKVWGGEWVTLDIPASVDSISAQPQAIKLEVIYEDSAVLVINKPPGLVVHPGNGNWQGTLLNGLLHYAPQLEQIPRAGIVHRLDKDTSGLLVVAKTLVAQTSLVRQLQSRTVTREYVALVHGRVSNAGEVNAPIGRHRTQRTKMAVVENGKAAVTHFQPIRRLADCTLIRCKLETGRTHQIRVHMQQLGHPLVGDPVYGPKKRDLTAAEPIRQFPRQALHAARLAFVHPVTGQTVTWEAVLPGDFLRLLEALGGAETAHQN